MISRASTGGAFLLLTISTARTFASTAAQGCEIHQAGRGVRLTSGADSIDLELLQSNVLRVDVELQGKVSPRTLVMDPALKTSRDLVVSTVVEGDSARIQSPALQVSIDCASRAAVTVNDAVGLLLVKQVDLFGDAGWHDVHLLHATQENLYGMNGLSMHENGGGLLRNNGAEVGSGVQGDAGTPWFFTTRFGVLIDSIGGGFDTRDGEVRFWGGSRDDMEYFVIAGAPKQSISGLADLTGHSPMPPKWTLGFINRQWGSSEDEIKQLAATYRAKHIPIDAFIMDYDWKAWGEDNYGEWRWNSISTPESASPNKFPGGASGEFATEMRAQGIKLAGILKPRIVLYKKGSTTEMHEAAAYAQAHDLWYPGETPGMDAVVRRPTRNLDFSKAETRSWYWKHLEPTFDAGMAAWRHGGRRGGLREQPPILKHGASALRRPAVTFQSSRVVDKPQFLPGGTTLQLCSPSERRPDRAVLAGAKEHLLAIAKSS